MSNFIKVFLLLITLQLPFSGIVKAQAGKEQKLACEVLTDLQENILPFWVKHASDPSGGFYGTILNNGVPLPQSPKGGVLNARILWTFSRAYYYFKNEEYKELADRAQEYFIQYFIDKKYAGSFWTVNADGSPQNTAKQTYGIAFAIYGMAEHFRATGNKESLKQAVSLYNTLEKYAFDSVNGGYIESFERDWMKPEKYGYDGSGIAPKTMNTHLHVLEAYTLLYEVWPDKGLKKQLRNLISVFLNKIINKETWHQRLYLTMDWENLEHIDSYGHDIELSWLLLEAAKVLKDEVLIDEVKVVSLNLVDTQMTEGWSKVGFLNYERVNGELDSKLEWWPQAESVIAFFNAWQMTGDEKYLDASVKTWDWIKTNLIDNENGEWFGGLDSNNKPNTRRPKADLWKCPYHNSRMGFELYIRSGYYSQR